jgi:hypothetical protein
MSMACSKGPYPGFSSVTPNIYFKRLAVGDGLTYLPDSMYINYSYTLISLDSSNNNFSRLIKYARPNLAKAPRFLQSLQTGDRLEIILTQPDRILEDWFQIPSSFFPVKVNLLIEAVHSPYQKKNTLDHDGMEFLKISDHLQTSGEKDNYTFQEGIWMQLVSRDSLRKFDSEVILEYRGFFLNGNPMDSPDYPLRFYRGDQMQVIPGISIALKYLANGDSARVIIPSHLAFGEYGSADGNIPPYEPLRYHLKLLYPETPANF